jgi:hypothetical protein
MKFCPSRATWQLCLLAIPCLPLRETRSLRLILPLVVEIRTRLVLGFKPLRHLLRHTRANLVVKPEVNWAVLLGKLAHKLALKRVNWLVKLLGLLQLVRFLSPRWQKALV